MMPGGAGSAADAGGEPSSVARSVTLAAVASIRVVRTDRLPFGQSGGPRAYSPAQGGDRIVASVTLMGEA
ncbi:hypothetical protein GCM10009725_21950 [Aeromicrobium tamlense]